MVLLTNQQFMDELTKLFQSNKTKGSVWLTMKRYEEKPPKEKGTAKGGAAAKGKEKAAAKAAADFDPEPKCLLRATDGKDTKLSTLVRSKDVVRFQLAFATMMKNNMDGLKKRERKGRKGRKKVAAKHV